MLTAKRRCDRKALVGGDHGQGKDSRTASGFKGRTQVWNGIGEYVCTRKNRKRDSVEDGGCEEEEEEEARVVVEVVVVIGDIAVWPGQLRMQ